MTRRLLLLLALLTACSPGTSSPRSTEGQPEVAAASRGATTENTGSTEAESQRPTLSVASASAVVSLGGLPTTTRENAARTCPEGMVHVEGEYCSQVEHNCQRYLDPPGRYHEYRCAAYDPPRCTTSRVRMSFCIDAREYSPPDQTLPANRVSFRDAQRICGELGKRVCTESEWNFACEGEAMRPYPYGDRRDARACHADRTDLWEEDGRTVRDQRVPSGSYAGCVSPFGVFDMAGNVEEFVERDDDPGKPAMKGAWWLPGRNTCRARQTFHNEDYHGVETGFRCCAEVNP